MVAAGLIGILAAQVGEEAKYDKLGVCSYDAENVTCWDMTGKPAPKLADQVTAMFLTGYRDLGFTFRKKNRLLVIRRNQSTQGNYRLAENRSLNTMTLYGGETVIDCIRVAVEGSEKSISLEGVVSLEPVKVRIPFAKGAKVDIQQGTFELGAWKKGTPEPNRYPAVQGNFWQIVAGFQSEKSQGVYFQYVALDRDGQVIRWVDRKGIPVKSIKALEQGSSTSFAPFRPDGTPSKFVPAFTQGASGGDAFFISTNIDPGHIKALDLLYGRQSSFSLGSFPLDPTP